MAENDQQGQEAFQARRPLWLLVLAICAAPIALPLGAGILAVLVSLAVGMAALLAGLALCGVTLLGGIGAGGVMCVVGVGPPPYGGCGIWPP